MGQGQLKKVRKAAEKTAKSMALELAKAQLMEIANAKFKMRWQFCKAILFPKILKVKNEEIKEVQKKAHGEMNEQLKKEKEKQEISITVPIDYQPILENMTSAIMQGKSLREEIVLMLKQCYFIGYNQKEAEIKIKGETYAGK